jgi:DNA-binding LacI/PurR family transcriptional regulator
MMKKELFEKIVKENFLDGLLLVNMHLNHEEYRRITEKMPLTLVAAQTDFAESVAVDHYKGICMGVDYLNQLGHRVVAFINNEKEILESTIRERAFRERAEEYGMQYKIDYRPVDRRSGYLAARSILENNNDVTCLFYYSDLMAYGGLDYTNERQLQPDVSIIGFDGFEMTFQVSLTTIVQPMEKMGELGANMLIERIENPDAEEKRIVLDPWLDKGKTCGARSHEQ